MGYDVPSPFQTPLRDAGHMSTPGSNWDDVAGAVAAVSSMGYNGPPPIGRAADDGMPDVEPDRRRLRSLVATRELVTQPTDSLARKRTAPPPRPSPLEAPNEGPTFGSFGVSASGYARGSWVPAVPTPPCRRASNGSTEVLRY